MCCEFCKWSVSRIFMAMKANPVLELLKLSYLWVEAYLTDVAGDDWPLCLHHRWPKGVRHHSLLDRVHLRRDSPEVTSKIQHHRRNSEASASPNCSALKGSAKWMWMREREALKKKCRWMTASEGEERLGDKIELGKREVKREQWLMRTGRCVFSLQQLVLLSVPEFLGAVQTL